MKVPCHFCGVLLDEAGPGEFRKQEMVKLPVGFVTVCKECMKKIKEGRK